VMEKCHVLTCSGSWSAQHATEAGVTFDGKQVETACQRHARPRQLCSEHARSGADISRYREHPAGYDVLGELNVKPNVTYLGRLRNIHSEKRA